jgi:16S rRNA (cytosine1402-N4)-methyltransferase
MVTRPDGVYCDLTCGGGGHLEYASQVLSSQALLIGIDRDSEAIAATGARLASIAQNLKLVEAEFGRFDEILADLGLKRVDGILLDLGVSSHQLDSPDRGFAYMSDGPLDMRMGIRGGLTAEQVINNYSQEELTALFRKYGEEKRASRAAAAICRERTKGKIETTRRLREILEPVFSKKEIYRSLARIFQAIRIEVNGELDQLREVLPKALDCLAVGGHLVVISYHSLEDRMVKRFMAEKAKGCICPPNFPVCVCGRQPELKILTKKAMKSSLEEIRENGRAKSARLRAAEKSGIEK